MIPKVLERLSVVDGIVAAVGYCPAAETPELIYDGAPIRTQECLRFRRPDVAAAHDEDDQTRIAFRIAAIIEPAAISDYSKLSVRFSDGSIARRNIPNIMDAHLLLNKFAEDVERHPGSSMLEIGSRARSGKIYKDRFPSLGRYVGLDIAEGPNVDLIADAHTMSRSISERFDYAFSVSTFEHLMMPWVVAYELGKVMRLGGLIYMQSHPTYPLHEEPWDFFRFSRNAWKGLFNRFTGFEIIETGYSIEAAIVPLNASNGALQYMDRSKTFLVSACMARKVCEPSVDWSAEPGLIADLQYSYASRPNV